MAVPLDVDAVTLVPRTSREDGSLYEHCRRAIDYTLARMGRRGLPLIGTGDWNDGFNKVGVNGQGESVWLAWFLYDVLTRFAGVCDQIPAHPEISAAVAAPNGLAAQYRAMARAYAENVEAAAWDGDWYRRAFYDDGAPLGSVDDPECQIDAIAQSWAVISGAGEPAHARTAMQSVLDRLVRPRDRLSLLFTPPFDQSPRDPGYIKGYLPGTRENGGQYTHAAIWTAWAFARLGDGQQAGALFDLLNPIYQSNTRALEDQYRVEPYVICADIYSVAPYLRRGGWTWYSGSAGWMYRLGLEALLGLHRVAGRLRIDPVIPPQWDGFSIDYRYGSAAYHIQVTNPDHVPSGVRRVTVDGQDGDIGLVDDGQEHTVQVEMGSAT
jgi:cyclic beta-1,2-glucan synthetase